jgi:dihydroorotate dehydrogenase (fumarate)
MDLSTRYLGIHLPHPLMSGASPLVDDLDMVRRLEDAGAAAIVMHSLFEEQIEGKRVPEALLGPDAYLEQLGRIKRSVHVPVIASLNGTSLGGWLSYARLLQQAGADALELNVYTVPTDADESAQAIEARTIEIVRAVRAAVGIPLAVKLSPFYTSLAHFARRVDEVGPEGLVLFNRFYQPGIDVEEFGAQSELRLSGASELPLRLHWLAILAPRLRASLAASGGIHTVTDVVQAVMAGAHAVQLVAALLRAGPERLAALRMQLAEWLEGHGYHSLRDIQGKLSLVSCSDPQATERADYMRMLSGWGRWS